MKLTAANVAKALYKNHNFEPDVAFSAAACWLTGKLPDVPVGQAQAWLDMIIRWPNLTDAQIEEILTAYRHCKMSS